MDKKDQILRRAAMECNIKTCSWWSGDGCTASDGGAFCPLKKIVHWQDYDPALINRRDETMTNEKFAEIVREQIERCETVLLRKSAEYSTKQDKLHNFRLAAGLQGCSEKEALYGMWAKHLVSLSDMCRSGKSYALELWQEKITDTINYALLLYGLVREEQNEKGKSET